MRKFISLIILVSMTLHCLSRLEVISYVYSHRHDIAFTLGFATERATAMCKSDHFSSNTLITVSDADESEDSGPAAAQEILLAAPPAVVQSPAPSAMDLPLPSSGLIVADPNPISQSLFHPPLV